MSTTLTTTIMSTCWISKPAAIPEDAAMPTIDPVTGVITWTPTATGRFAIRVIVVNGDREADQETFLVDIVASDVDTGA